MWVQAMSGQKYFLFVDYAPKTSPVAMTNILKLPCLPYTLAHATLNSRIMPVLESLLHAQVFILRLAKQVR